MDMNQKHGLYLYERTTRTSSPVMRELLQLSKTVAPGKSQNFSFIHDQGSLIPHLSLWENIQLSSSLDHWEDFVRAHQEKLGPLIALIREPYKKAKFAETWESFLVSLMKGILEPTPTLLVDVREDSLNPFTVQTVKRALMNASHTKSIYLASGAPSLWLDCAHHLVRKKEYQFIFEELGSEELRRHWSA